MYTFETIPLGSTITYTDSTGKVRKAHVYKKVESFKFDGTPKRSISVEYKKPIYEGSKQLWPCRTALSKFTNITKVE